MQEKNGLHLVTSERQPRKRLFNELTMTERVIAILASQNQQPGEESTPIPRHRLLEFAGIDFETLSDGEKLALEHALYQSAFGIEVIPQKDSRYPLEDCYKITQEAVEDIGRFIDLADVAKNVANIHWSFIEPTLDDDELPNKKNFQDLSIAEKIAAILMVTHQELTREVILEYAGLAEVTQLSGQMQMEIESVFANPSSFGLIADQKENDTTYHIDRATANLLAETVNSVSVSMQILSRTFNHR
jgi:hypothetical protein